MSTSAELPGLSRVQPPWDSAHRSTCPSEMSDLMKMTFAPFRVPDLHCSDPRKLAHRDRFNGGRCCHERFEHPVGPDREGAATEVRPSCTAASSSVVEGSSEGSWPTTSTSGAACSNDVAK